MHPFGAELLIAFMQCCTQMLSPLVLQRVFVIGLFKEYIQVRPPMSKTEIQFAPVVLGKNGGDWIRVAPAGLVKEGGDWIRSLAAARAGQGSWVPLAPNSLPCPFESNRVKKQDTRMDVLLLWYE